MSTVRSSLVVAVATLVLLGGCSPSPTSVEPAPTEVAAEAPDSIGGLSGTDGAVDFSAGVIVVGSGAKIVDSYFDPMCPYCAFFEAANLPTLERLVADGSITLRLHPLVFLDRLSEGTAYSTRAANALTAVGVEAPDAVLPFLSLLFQNQPGEGTAGLTDGELIALADQATAGSVALAEVQAQRPYAAWLAELTELALTVDGVTSVPSVLVNGELYTGALDDSAAFIAFVEAN